MEKNREVEGDDRRLRCACICPSWGHLDVCTGLADSFELVGSHLTGSFAVPICASCQQAVRRQMRVAV